MTKPTGRPRGRPRKEKVEDILGSDDENYARKPWRQIHAAREAEDEAREAAKGDGGTILSNEEFLDEELKKPVRYGRRAKLEPTEEILRLIGELSKLFATQAEIAGVLGVPRMTFVDFLNRHEEARDVFDNGQAHAKISLRRKQLALADKNAPAGIFLGKNYLGQKDEHHSVTRSDTPANELTKEQLMEIARRAPKSNDPTIKIQ
jgi:hypothetical protein